jgi:hypothetical protein
VEEAAPVPRLAAARTVARVDKKKGAIQVFDRLVEERNAKSSDIQLMLVVVVPHNVASKITHSLSRVTID